MTSNYVAYQDPPRKTADGEWFVIHDETDVGWWYVKLTNDFESAFTQRYFFWGHYKEDRSFHDGIVYSKNKEHALRQFCDIADVDLDELEGIGDLRERQKLDRKTNFGILPVLNEEFDQIHLGMKWGVKRNPKYNLKYQMSYGSLDNQHHRNFSLLHWSSWFTHGYKMVSDPNDENQVMYVTPVDTVSWEDGAEDKCILNIHKGLREVVLEHLWDLFEHHNLHAEMHGLVTDDFLATKIRDEQVLSAHKNFRNKLFSKSSNQRTEVAYQIQNVWKNIDSALVAGTDLKKTLEVCAKFIDGKLGMDWFIPNMFDIDKQPVQEQMRLEYLNRAWIDKAQTHSGQTVAHIDNSRLKPLFKAHPDVARLYA